MDKKSPCRALVPSFCIGNVVAWDIDAALSHDGIIRFFPEFSRIPMLYIKCAVGYAGQFIHSKLLHVIRQ